MLDTFAPFAGLVGLIGFAGLWGFRYKLDQSRSGGRIRLLGLLGLFGLAGIWVPGVGAIGAAGALGLWNHKNPRLALWGKLGWSFVLGLPYLLRWALE